MGLKPFKGETNREFAGWLTPDTDAAPEAEIGIDLAAVDPAAADVTEEPEVAAIIEDSLPDDAPAILEEEEVLEEAELNIEEDSETKAPETAAESELTQTHQSYYQCSDPNLEAIKVIHAYMMDFDIGSAYKYLIRAGRKTDDATMDLKKALWFLQDEKDDPCLVGRIVPEAVPTADDVISAFNLDYYVGTAIAEILEYCNDNDTKHLDVAIAKVSRKVMN